MSLLLNENSLVSMTDFIVEVYHNPLRHNLQWIEKETLQLAQEYGKRVPEMFIVRDLFQQFKSEITTHMMMEEAHFFPTLVRMERCAQGLESFTDCDLEKFEGVIRRLELEHEHFDTYVFDIVRIFKKSSFRYEEMFVFSHFFGYYSMLENELMRHTELENAKLHSLAKKIFCNVCHLPQQ
jgi:regulator of cell morphogenesis and NO signaling